MLVKEVLTMVKIKTITSMLAVMSMVIFVSGCVKKEPIKPISPQMQAENTTVKKTSIAPKIVEKKYDLYSSTPYDLPLFSVIEISKLSDVVKTTIDKVLELSQGFYLLRAENDKVLVVLQNPAVSTNTYPRHELQFAEIDMDGNVKYHSAGYSGIDGETLQSVFSKDEVWEYDESTEPFRPLKHIVYDEKGKIKFTEIWNYSEKDSVKYQMKDGHKKIVSILREFQDNDSNLRREHVFYDNEGQTKMSLSVNFDGANVSRLIFYNAHDSIDSMSIISEFTDGFKTKELVYDEDYQLVNTVTSEYIDGERKSIKLFDSEGKELKKISS